MRPTTPLELLALLEKANRSSSNTKAQPSTQPLSKDDTRDQLRIKRDQLRIKMRKIALVATFCAFNLRGYKDRDGETWVTLCETKRDASKALRTCEALIRPRPLKNFNIQMERFSVQYGTLSCSLGQLYLIMAPDLADRAETAF